MSSPPFLAAIDAAFLDYYKGLRVLIRRGSVAPDTFYIVISQLIHSSPWSHQGTKLLLQEYITTGRFPAVDECRLDTHGFIEIPYLLLFICIRTGRISPSSDMFLIHNEMRIILFHLQNSCLVHRYSRMHMIETFFRVPPAITLGPTGVFEIFGCQFHMDQMKHQLAVPGSCLYSFEIDSRIYYLRKVIPRAILYYLRTANRDRVLRRAAAAEYEKDDDVIDDEDIGSRTKYRRIET
jgi:hypothetical protein